MLAALKTLLFFAHRPLCFFMQSFLKSRKCNLAIIIKIFHFKCFLKSIHLVSRKRLKKKGGKRNILETVEFEELNLEQKKGRKIKIKMKSNPSKEPGKHRDHVFGSSISFLQEWNEIKAIRRYFVGTELKEETANIHFLCKQDKWHYVR